MFKILKNTAILCWRIWFYILTAVVIIFFSPLLIILVSYDKYYPIFFKLCRFWAKVVLYGMGFYPKVERLQKMVKGNSYMIVANHTSMIDIMLMLYVVPENPFVFVGKKEIADTPLFGYFYRKTSILVDRSSAESRKDVYRQAKERLSKGLSICIFPEGLVPDDESVVLADFKNGAFSLAIEHQIPIVPMSFYDCKKRFSFTFFSGSLGALRVKIHPFVSTKGLTLQDKNDLKQQVYDLMYNDLVVNG
ncbi:MAG: 1-acyl-sn-glycerol-3-phosphate acyltransferase [Flavobacteriaceae bacterium]|nr:1-acyl-sn-glycerol-3-phosphate acyltransferase [Flavobacteriaceae bacterium]